MGDVLRSSKIADNEFDILIIDGIKRNECFENSIQYLKDDGTDSSRMIVQTKLLYKILLIN